MDKVSFESVKNDFNSSFRAEAYQNAFFAAPLHIHTEYELILIEKGEGTNFVGDSIRKLHEGDFMLIGSKLPHLWLSSDKYYEKGTPHYSQSVYAQFGPHIFPDSLLQLPEMFQIKELLEKSKRGLIFSGQLLNEIKDDFRKVPKLSGFIKLMQFYRVLYRLGVDVEGTPLSSDNFNDAGYNSDDLVVQRSYDYLNEHYQNQVKLDDIADYVGMNSSALCRYFKKHTGKTLFQYLNEMRISYAVKLFMNRSMAINQVAYDCGYNSLSHFNKQFKTIVGKTPSEYCKFLSQVK